MTNPNKAKLGAKQASFLSALIQHGYWHNGPTCGWSWDGTGNTERLLKSARLRELVTTSEERKSFGGVVTVYRPNLSAIANSESAPERVRTEAAQKLEAQDD